MVKKLLKHEFIYYIRTFGICLPILLVFSLLTRILFWTDSSNIVLNAISASAFVVFLIACLALILMSTVISVVRFYKHMYTAEGYLTFTLPVTNAQHIFVKLISAFIFQLVCGITVILAAFIVLVSPDLFSAIAVMSNGIKDLIASMQLSIGDIIGYSLEVFLIALVAPITNMLLYYACITIGQMSKKNRVFAAILVYFVYQMATQAISTVFSVLFSFFSLSSFSEPIWKWCINHMAATVHIYLILTALGIAALGVVFWFATHRIMSKKLNLE